MCAPRAEVAFLGSEVSISGDSVDASLPDRKTKDLLHDLRRVLRRGTLSPGQAAEIRGRLGLEQSMLFGGFGRARLAPFAKRQYSEAAGNLTFRMSWWP